MSTQATNRQETTECRADDLEQSVRRAFELARAARRGWASRSLGQRVACLGRLRRLMVENVDRLVDALDAGHVRAPGESLAAELLPTAEACRFLQKHARSILRPRRTRNRLFPLWLARTEVRIEREPLGVVLIVGPSNYPLFLVGVQLVQALVAGNAVVVKPGRTGGEVINLFAQLLVRAGVPEGTVQVLDESAEAGRAAVAAGPDKVLVTGGVATGRAILAGLAESVTPSVMELSGCDAVLVHDRADLHHVARCVAFGMRINGGATCIGPHRLFAQAQTMDRLKLLLVDVLSGIGPVPVGAAIASRCRELTDDAISQGAHLLCGEVTDDDRVAPMVFDRASPRMQLARSDVFAPVLGLIEVGSMDEVFEADRECPFALGASVFAPEAIARDWASRIDAGCVTVNDLVASTAHPEAPFGGRGLSGFGVTRGREGLLAMTQVKAIVIRRGASHPHLSEPSPTVARALGHYFAATHGSGVFSRMKHLLSAARQLRRSASEGDGSS